MNLWYLFQTVIKEHQSRAKWVYFQRFSAWRIVDLKAWRLEVYQRLNRDWRLVNLVMI